MANRHVAHACSPRCTPRNDAIIQDRTIDFGLGRTSASKAIVVFSVLLSHLVFMYALSCIGCSAEALDPSSRSLGRLNLASLSSPSLRMPSNSPPKSCCSAANFRFLTRFHQTGGTPGRLRHNHHEHIQERTPLIQPPPAMMFITPPSTVRIWPFTYSFLAKNNAAMPISVSRPPRMAGT